MSTFLKVIRYFFAIIFILILLLIFYIGIPTATTTQVFINRDNVKTILSNSGVYDNVVDLVIEQSGTIDTADESEIVTLIKEDPEFKLNLQTIFSAEEIQPKIETVIDAIYDWLEGKSSYPEFEVYLIDDEETFKDLFSSVMMIRMEGLPTCSDNVQPIPTDMMDIECIPAGTNLNNLEMYFEEAMDSGDMDTTEILESFKLSSDQLNISYDTSILVQGIFKIVKIFPILLALVIFLLTVIILLLIPSAKGAFITTSVIYILTGLLFLAIGSVRNVSQIVSNSISTYDIDIPYSQMQDISTNLFTPIFELVLHRMFQFSLILLGAGIILLVIGLVIKKKKKEEVNVQEPIKDEKVTESKSEDTI
jgi:hypothetical protein